MPSPALWAALLAAAGLLTGCRTPESWAAMDAAIGARFPSVTHLTTAELATWLSRPDTAAPVLVDSRAPGEYAVSHLAGAHLTPGLSDALAVLADAPADTPIVAYCSVGYRSAELVEKLQEAGFSQVRNLQGSIFRWANEGRPVYRDSVQVQTVHPYGKPWSRLLDPERRASLAR